MGRDNHEMRRVDLPFLAGGGLEERRIIVVSHTVALKHVRKADHVERFPLWAKLHAEERAPVGIQTARVVGGRSGIIGAADPAIGGECG